MTVNCELVATDILLVRSSSLFGRLIRIFTRSRGEAPTRVNHVEIMVDSVNVVGSGATTLLRPFKEAYGSAPPGTLYIARKVDLTDEQRQVIAAKARSYVGRKYGWLKIVAHFLDRVVFGGHYVTRRLCLIDQYPICSWEVAWSYDAAGLNFGVPPGQADPDDIWDWVVEKGNKDWVLIYPTNGGRPDAKPY